MRDMSEIRDQLYSNLLTQMKIEADVVGLGFHVDDYHPNSVECDLCHFQRLGLYEGSWEWQLLNGSQLSESSWVAVNHNAPDDESGVYFMKISNDEVSVGVLDVKPVTVLSTERINRTTNLLSKDRKEAIEEMSRYIESMETEIAQLKEQIGILNNSDDTYF